MEDVQNTIIDVIPQIFLYSETGYDNEPNVRMLRMNTKIDYDKKYERYYEKTYTRLCGKLIHGASYTVTMWVGASKTPVCKKPGYKQSANEQTIWCIGDYWMSV